MGVSRGWAMAVAAAATNFVTFGILFSFGLLLSPLADEFDASTASVAAVFSGSILAYYLAGAIGGLASDRWGARPVVLFGAVALPAGLVLAGGSDRLWQLAGAYVILVGLAVGCCYAPLIGAVGRALPEHGSLAIGVVLTGVGAGTLVMPVAIRALLDQGGWRSALRILAVVALAVLAAAVATVDDRFRGPAAARTVPWPSIRARRFRRLYLSVVLISPGFFAPIAFLNDYAVDRGIDPSTAALLVGAIGAGSVATRIGFGALAPRLGPLRQYRLSHVVFLVGLATWWAAGSSQAALAVAAVAHGVAWAAWVTAAPQVLADWFGLDDLGLAVGGFYTGLGLGALIGPPVTGVIVDAAGYRPAVAFTLVTTVASLAALASVTGPGGGTAAQEPARPASMMRFRVGLGRMAADRSSGSGE